jgi:zinc transport system ATP-binding protein
MKIQIEGRDLRLGYDGVCVCEGLSFAVRKGDYFCIVGSNGSGKSTLMRTLLRLKSPMGGELIFSEECAPCRIGYLPQQGAHGRDFPATVREVVLSGCVGNEDFRLFPSKAHKEKADGVMKRLGISELARRPFGALSGGQQQRVMLARALMATADLLLLDEPVSGLDPDAALRFYDTVEELNREGVTVIMITHDLPAVETYATAVLHMEKTPVFYPTAEAWKGGETHGDVL